MATIILPRKSVFIPSLRPQGIPVLNRDHFFADGLKGWWPSHFRSGQKVLHDYSGNGNDLVNLGNTNKEVFDSNLGRGIRYPVAMGNDPNRAYEVSHNLGITEFPVTIAVWCHAIRKNRFSHAMSFSDSTDTSVYGIRRVDTNVWQGIWDSTFLFGVVPVTFNRPELIVFSCFHADLRILYVNGLLDAVTTTTDSFGDPDRLRIGSSADSTPGNVWEGHIWDSAIWNRTFTEDEIFEMYNAPTRWGHYWQPSSYIVVKPPPQDIEGSLLTDADTFNEGFVQPIGMRGSTLEDADILNHGVIISEFRFE